MVAVGVEGEKTATLGPKLGVCAKAEARRNGRLQTRTVRRFDRMGDQDIPWNKRLSCDCATELEDLVELEAFAVRAGDVEVSAAPGPEREEDGCWLQQVVAGGLEREERCVNVGYVEGDVVDVAVGTGRGFRRGRSQGTRTAPE